MTLTTFDGIDGYAYLDVDGATVSVGPARNARKVLDRTSIDLARHATYALAVHGVDASGAAVALNHDRAGDEPLPLDAFLTAAAEWAVGVGYRAHTGLGFDDAELGDLLASSSSTASVGQLNNASAVASWPVAEASALIASTDDEADLRELLNAAGASSVQVEADLEAALAASSDVLFVRGRTGAIDHTNVAETGAAAIVGLEPLTTTARGLAIASSSGVVVVPDFISAGGPYLAAVLAADPATPSSVDGLLDAVRAATSAVAAELADAGVGAFIAACEMAEDHLRTWATELPFGRPLAP